jgi:DNA-binding GntR family transcriptional regulator
MQRAVSSVDIGGYNDLNRTLHRRVREIGGQQTAASITQRLLNQSTRQSFQVSLIPGRMSASLREHERIVRAIDAGDGHRAERAMRTHLDAVSIDLRKVWTSRALPE